MEEPRNMRLGGKPHLVFYIVIGSGGLTIGPIGHVPGGPLGQKHMFLDVFLGGLDSNCSH